MKRFVKNPSAVEQHPPLARLDVGGVVVPLLHLLEGLLLREGEAVLLEARLAQHLHEDPERLVEVVGEAVEAGGAGDGPDPGRDLGGEEVELLVELLGGQALRPAPAHLRADEAGEALLAGGLEPAPDAHRERDVHEGKRPVLGDVDDHAVLQARRGSPSPPVAGTRSAGRRACRDGRGWPGRRRAPPAGGQREAGQQSRLRVMAVLTSSRPRGPRGAPRPSSG